MKSIYKKIGDFVRQVNNRNSDLKVMNLKGINIQKEFMPSVANINGTDLSRYKIVKNQKFSFNPMHVGRDEILPISLWLEEQEIIVSPAYIVFEIIDMSLLDPEYLMIWCMRSEFDRRCWFTTDNTVRGGLDWNDFCELPIVVPSLQTQKEIVKQYITISGKVKNNLAIIERLEDTAESIYKEWFLNFEYPVGNINHSLKETYKSSKGTLEYSDILDIEIPKGWSVKEVSEVAKLSAGGDRPAIFSFTKTEICKYPIYSNTTENDGLFGFTNKSKINSKSITISARGAGIGYTMIRNEPYFPIVRLISIIPNNLVYTNYLYYFFKKYNYEIYTSASAQSQLTVPEVGTFKILLPDQKVVEKFQNITDSIFDFINRLKKEILTLNQLLKILQDKLVKG